MTEVIGIILPVVAADDCLVLADFRTLVVASVVSIALVSVSEISGLYLLVGLEKL